MHHSTLVPRGLALAGAAALALTGLATTAPPASAAVFNGAGSASTSFSPGGGCTVSSDTSTSQTVPISSGAGPFVFNLNSSAVSTKTGDPTDTSSLAASIQGSMSVNESGSSLTSFDLNAATTLKVDRAKDALSACSPQALASATLSSGAPVVLLAPTMLDLSFKSHGGVGSSLTLVFQRTDAPSNQLVEVDLNSNQISHRLISLPAGQYTVVAAASYNLTAGAGTPETTTYSYALHGDFVAAGSASSLQKGTGGKYLALAGAVNCGNQSVTADFQAAAGKKVKKPKKGHKAKKPVISTATFYVNDVKVATVKKPNKNTLTTLTVPNDEATVEAILKLRGKGTVDVRRSYRPCS